MVINSHASLHSCIDMSPKRFSHEKLFCKMKPVGFTLLSNFCRGALCGKVFSFVVEIR